MVASKKPSSRSRNEWRPQLVVDAYVLARTGLSETNVAQALGIPDTTLAFWKRKHPELLYALDRAKKDRGGQAAQSFREYVYKRLPAELQSLWDQIDLWTDHVNGTEKVEALLADKGVHVQQSLFMHAMVTTNFNASEALRRLSIPKSRLDFWTTSDPDFHRLVSELDFHKKNFFESALVDLVAEGNTLATIFVNRAKNKDRGYNEKVTVHHEGTIQHDVNLISVDDLELPLDVRRQILEAIRARKLKLGNKAPPSALVKTISHGPEATESTSESSGRNSPTLELTLEEPED